MTQPTLFGDEPDLAAFFSRLEHVTGKRGLTHTLHPWPAKFIPQIPRALIQAYALPELPVLDPMCGSGTSLVEAAVLGRDAVGVDLNPIAVLASRAKTTVLSSTDRGRLHEVVSRLRGIGLGLANGRREMLEDHVLPSFHNIERWFDTEVVRELAMLRDMIEDIELSSPRTVAQACFSSIIVSVSNQEGETSWRRRQRDIALGDPTNRLAEKIEAALRGLLEYSMRDPGLVAVHQADARELPIDDESIGMVVTSPPYANSHDYYLYNKLRLFWLGWEVAPIQNNEIGSRNKHSDQKQGIETYREAMTGVLREIRRVLVPRAAAAIVVADAVIRGEFFSMDEEFLAIGRATDLEPVDLYRFEHRRFNSTFQRGFGTAHRKQTHVLIFRA